MGTTERRERERQQRRDMILSAARTLFFEKGFRDTTIDEIARATELARGTVYLYFPTKEEIYATILEEGLDIFFDYMTSTYRPDVTALDNLLAVLDASLRFRDEQGDYSNALMVHRLEIHDLLSEELQQRMATKVERMREWLRGLLAKGIDRGEFRPMPVEETTSLMMALYRGFLLMQGDRFCQHDDRALKAALHDFVAAAVLART